MSDIYNIYNELITEFNKLYPEMKVKVNNNEIDSYVNNFIKKLRDETGLFKYLVEKDNRLFKGLKCTLIPKKKMEVVLYADDKTIKQKEIIDNMWKNIWLIYLLGESKMENPDKIKMSKITNLMENGKKEDDLPKMFDALKDMDIDKMKELFESKNINTDKINDILKDGFDMDKMKDLMNDNDIKNLIGSINIEPTENSNKFIDNILDDIKDKFKLNEIDGKIDSKEFVDKLLDVGNVLGDSYGNKLKSGELSINDIIGGVSSLMSDKKNDKLSEISKSIDLDKIDVGGVFNEFKGKLDGKVPKEMMDVISGLNGDNLKNLNLGSLVDTMIGGDKKVQELTDEQKKELEKYYENLEI